jgi:hypothetical protein
MKCKNIKKYVGHYLLWKAVTAQALKAYGEAPGIVSAILNLGFSWKQLGSACIHKA